MPVVTWLKRLVEETCPAFALRPLLQARSRLRDGRRGGTAQDVFTGIYRDRYWGGESASGPGSELRATANVRAALPGLIAKYGVRSMLDAPCGDFFWMRHVPLDGVDYTGGDIVAPLVEKLQAEQGGPGRRFVHLDIITGPVPKADLILCRDCLIHLSFAQGRAALDNFKRSGARYLLSTTYPNKRVNWDIATGGARPVNLLIAPYDLPPALETIAEENGAGDPNAEHVLALWDLNAVTI